MKQAANNLSRIALAWLIVNTAALAFHPQTTTKQFELERERAYTRQQFQKNFRDLQTVTQGLLRDHEAARLTPQQLNKAVKTINKCAKTLRTMMALGSLAKPTEFNRGLRDARQFDAALRRLSKLVWDFAHNPVHQSSKVFNTDQAERAQTDLLAIISLTKILESEAKAYAAATQASAQSHP